MQGKRRACGNKQGRYCCIISYKNPRELMTEDRESKTGEKNDETINLCPHTGDRCVAGRTASIQEKVTANLVPRSFYEKYMAGGTVCVFKRANAPRQVACIHKMQSRLMANGSSACKGLHRCGIRVGHFMSCITLMNYQCRLYNFPTERRIAGWQWRYRKLIWARYCSS